MSKLDAALAWAARGFRVFPLGANSAEPVWKGWTDWASSDPTTINAWWNGQDFNIGVLTTGMLVVDVDVKPDKVTRVPRRGLETWTDLHGGFDTLTVRTRSGGYHLYYADADVALSAGDLGEGLDIRSHNGYVIAPGSIIDGCGYTVVIDEPMAQAPPEIVARCRAPGERLANAAAMLVETDSKAAIGLAVAKIVSTPGAVQGEQSEQAYKLACHVRDFGISEALAGTLMDVWAATCSPPIGPDDLRGRIANAYAYAQNPGGAKNPEVMFGQIILPELPPEALAPVQVAHGYPFGNATLLADLRPRPHVLKRLLLRREITALIAPGGMGKSLFELVVAIHLAAGIDCFGYQNCLGAPSKSIVYNAEDSLDEMSMRLYAVCNALSIDPAVVIPRISLISGKTHFRLRLVDGGPVPVMNVDAVKALVYAASDTDVAMVALDPLNKLHTVNGIDNIGMTFVMDVLEQIAEAADVALLLAHHTSKPSGLVRMAGNADSSQGASAVINSARTALTLTAPSDEDALRFGLSGKDRRYYLRLDDAKSNRSIGGDDPLWMRKVGVRLWNGEEVGGLERADMHKRTEHMRRMVADALRVGMVHSRGQAGVKLADAVKLLKGSGELFEKMNLDQLKQRIQTALYDPVTLEDGSVLRLLETQGSWMVVLQ